MNRSERRMTAKYTRQAAKRRPEKLTEIPRYRWPQDFIDSGKAPALAWESREFLAQLYEATSYQGIVCWRLSVCRVTTGSDGRWHDSITWDELYAVKAEVGYGDWYGIEIYPPAKHLVNVANMRHLWLFAHPLEIGWLRP